MIKTIGITIVLSLLSACTLLHLQPIHADLVISGGKVYVGDKQPAIDADVAICGEIICFVGQSSAHIKATKIIDAEGLIVTPGFIDPHTHSLQSLLDKDRSANLNYLTQGVTTVVNGNDGQGKADISGLREKFLQNGIGTNVGLLVGHGAVRKQVMGLSNKAPTASQLKQMKSLVASAMEQGALGLSTGLYYVPGSYSKIDEVIELAKVAAAHGGIYDSHIRDESTFSIGFLAAIDEVVEIAEKAKIKAHIAHIKALGVDVWGQSEQAVERINQARNQGLTITADQYPWQASGTFLHSAVIPGWVMADSPQAFRDRLTDNKLLPKIRAEVKENIRRRGGPKSLLITESKNSAWLGKTLAEIAEKDQQSAVDIAIEIVFQEPVRVASFNMSENDIHRFMQQDWVVTSSDGTDGHPRKYASFPKKYQQYVVENKLLSLTSFIHQSSAKTADIFGIQKRGRIKVGNYADLNVLDLKRYRPKANFSQWNLLSKGVVHQTVNGQLSIYNEHYTGALTGSVLTNKK